MANSLLKTRNYTKIPPKCRLLAHVNLCLEDLSVCVCVSDKHAYKYAQGVVFTSTQTLSYMHALKYLHTHNLCNLGANLEFTDYCSFSFRPFLFLLSRFLFVSLRFKYSNTIWKRVVNSYILVTDPKVNFFMRI